MVEKNPFEELNEMAEKAAVKMNEAGVACVGLVAVLQKLAERGSHAERLVMLGVVNQAVSASRAVGEASRDAMMFAGACAGVRDGAKAMAEVMAKATAFDKN